MYDEIRLINIVKVFRYLFTSLFIMKAEVVPVNFENRQVYTQDSIISLLKSRGDMIRNSKIR